MEKPKSLTISTGVNMLWKDIYALKLHALEFVPAPERLLFAPVDSRAALSELPDHVPLLSNWVDSRALSVVGASEKCAKASTERSHAIHNFSTSTSIVQVPEKMQANSKDLRRVYRKACAACTELCKQA